MALDDEDSNAAGDIESGFDESDDNADSGEGAGAAAEEAAPKPAKKKRKRKKKKKAVKDAAQLPTDAVPGAPEPAAASAPRAAAEAAGAGIDDGEQEAPRQDPEPPPPARVRRDAQRQQQQQQRPGKRRRADEDTEAAGDRKRPYMPRESAAKAAGAGRADPQASQGGRGVMGAVAARAGWGGAPREPQPRSVGNGSYPSYYDKRHVLGRGGAGPDDPRLPLLKGEWFKGKRCLDIGCNAGVFTLAMARSLAPLSMLGVDLDADLIAQANEQRTQALAEAAKRNVPPMLPRALRQTVKPGGESQELKLLRGCTFAVADFMTEAHWERMAAGDAAAAQQGDGAGAPPFDVICAFSVTKWVHLTGGDAAIQAFFKKVRELLVPGGALILEAQPWRSYSKNKNTSAQTAANYEAIRLGPANFKEYLLSVEGGFTSCVDAGVPAGVSKGFRREIKVYFK